MKTNSLIIKLTSIVVSIAWYLSIVSVAFWFIMITGSFITSDHIMVSVDGKFIKAPAIPGLHSGISIGDTFGVSLRNVSITLNIKVTPKIIIWGYLYVLSYAGPLLGILYYTRKIFQAINHKQPFHPITVKCFRHIAILLALLSPITYFIDMLHYYALVDHVPDFDQRFKMIDQASYKWLAAGAVAYIIAEIFRYGSELKKETEEFV